MGIPATLALGCLFLIIVSYLSLDIANWLEVILLVTGLAIVVVDLLFLPTFGLLGSLGGLLFLSGLFGYPPSRTSLPSPSTPTLTPGTRLVKRSWIVSAG